MKKLLQFSQNGGKKSIKRVFLLFFLTMSVSVLSAASIFNPQTRSFHLSNATIKEAIKYVLKDSKYNLIYSVPDVDTEKKITFILNNATIEEALNKIMNEAGLVYSVKDNNVVISKMQTPQSVITVKGKIIDSATKKPVTGATAIVVGTADGAITDEKGTFSLSMKSGVEVEFSFLGYVSVKRKFLKSEINVVIEMVQDVLAVDDVVVNGYYSRNKESLTGSVTIIKAEDIKKISPNNIFRALEAFEPSFQIVENKDAGSNPNNVPDILIRGKSSFEGKSNQPLFIMDGYEVSIETVFDYDIERIKTITILKDASATAVYGSRAANGVIVIETKLPELGKLSVSYSFNATVETPDLRDYNLMNAREKLEFETRAGVYVDNSSLIAQNRKDELYQSRYREMLQGVDTYWLSKPLQTAFKHSHSLSLGGGNEKSRYGLNANYGATPGVMKGSTRDRLGLNFTWTYLVSNKIRIGNTLTVSQNSSEESQYGSFSKYTGLNPYERTHKENGQLMIKLSDGELNPLYDASLNNEDKSLSTSYTDNFDVEWTVTKGLRLTGRMSYSFGSSETTNFKSPNSSVFLSKPTNERGLHKSSNATNNSLDANIVLNYNTVFAEKHSFSIAVGGNLQSNKQSSKGFSAQGFLSDNLSNIDFAVQYEKDEKPTGNVTKDRMIGLFGNIGYAYDNRYMLDLSYRTDGSSKFGKKDRFAPFWSLGGAWNIHNESFYNNSGWLTNAKIRGSVGYTGTVGFDAFQSQTMYFYSTENIYMHGIGADIKALGNDELKWQRQFSMNLGVDFDIFKGLFSFTAEIYKQKTTDLLIDMSIPPSLGFSTYKENLGEMSNKGYDVSVRSQILRNSKKDIYWSVAFGTGASVNKVDKISNALAKMNEDANAPDADNPDKNKKPIPLIEEGESVDALKAVPSLGIDPQTGREIFITRDGYYTTIWDYRDKVVVGSTTPKFRGNLSSFFSIKGISVNLSIGFQTGAKSYNETLAARVEGINPVNNADRRALTERWKNPGDKTFFKGIALQENTSNVTTRFVQKYNFLNISSLSLGYTLKQEVCKTIGFNGIRFNFNMSDLARFSTIKEERGLSYPYAKQFTFSVSVQL